MIFDMLFIATGIAFLYGGAEALVRGSTGLAFSYGLRPAVVGLTVVAYGTSMPEFVVSMSAAFNGSAALATGNIIGSNICNIGLIAGLTAMIKPLPVEDTLLKRDLPFVFAVTLLFFLACLDGSLGRLDGALLFAGLAAYTFYSIRKSIKDSGAAENRNTNIFRQAAMIIAGIAGLMFGARMLVKGAVSIAGAAGISDAVIGLSLVAFGTSLPELAASLVAAFKGGSGLSLGNLLGSNLFNMMMIGGLVAIVHPLPVPVSMLRLELPVMTAFVAALFPIMWIGRVIGRADGAILFAGYIATMVILFV